MTQPTLRDLERLMTCWEQAAGINRGLAGSHRNNGAMQGVFIARANELETCARQLREAIEGPKTRRCRCGRQISETPVGTWKHVVRIPAAMQNHIARPA